MNKQLLGVIKELEGQLQEVQDYIDYYYKRTRELRNKEFNLAETLAQLKLLEKVIV